MSERHPFHELSGEFTAERRQRIDAIKSKLLAEMSTDADERNDADRRMPEDPALIESAARLAARTTPEW